MVIFTDRKSTAIDSPRHLTLRHARRTVETRNRLLGLANLAEDEDHSSGPDLQPGEEKLNSFWAPGLEAGQFPYTISVTQDIDAKNGEIPLQLSAKQEFFVDAPQFSLPEGSVHSIYPPSGYSEDRRILPHVVLTDPHLPWERFGSPKAGEHTGDRNRVPWLALFSFTQAELRLGPEELAGNTGIFSNTDLALTKPVQQTSTMAVPMTVSDVHETINVTTPIAPSIKEGEGDFIFVKQDLFTSLFTPFDRDGKRRQEITSPDTSPFKFLSHVRKINTTGMALAGVEDIGIFSIVVGSRSGPLDNLAPTTVTVHLVSIEGVERMEFPIKTPYVALCSLHSWNYTVVPPGMLNVPDAFESLGRTLSVLRAPDVVIDPLKSTGTRLTNRLAARLEDGYSLVKYRTQTGEATVALLRGPFTPTTVKKEVGLKNKCSTSGIDLQILDKEVGIMDITYSVAWQLGRTMALGDQPFTAALGRLRAAIHKRAMQASKLTVVTRESPGSFRTRNNILEDLPDVVRSLASIHVTDVNPDNESGGADSSPSFSAGGPLRRWHRRRLRKRNIPHLSFTSSGIESNYLHQAIDAAQELAMSTDGTVYDETNSPVSTDWMVVLAWVMNRMFLAGVPAHYLITDPSHLEEESLRFFYIDNNWVDALVDGALSLGNHMGDDLDRIAIKTALNRYIRSVPETMPHAPQIPTYGFFLRSDLVTMFPDLKVTTLPAPPPGQLPDRAPLLRHEIIADGVMLGFLDRTPGSIEFDGLVFTQPPHQQRFAVGRRLDLESLQVDIRRQYTVEQHIRETDLDRHKALRTFSQSPTNKDNFFQWGSAPGLTDLRMMRMERYAEAQKNELMAAMGPRFFNDDTATSALFAMQLNDPIYNLTINLRSPEAMVVLAALVLPPPGDEVSFSASASVIERPRTLKRLEHSKVDKFRPDDEDDSSDESSDGEPDHDALTIAATFERADSSDSPALFNMAPHVRAITTTTTTTSTTTPTLALGLDTALSIPSAFHTPVPPPAALAFASSAFTGPSGPVPPATAPKYTCDIYSIGSNYIAIGDNLRQDLVFSILVDSNRHNSYQLVEFDVRIALGPARDVPRNYLFESYDGPGPTMLSNLRFNVLANFAVENDVKYLQLRVLPRSSHGWIDIHSVREISFMLSMAKVNEFDRDFNQVTVESLAQYLRDPASPRKETFVVNVERTKSGAIAV